MKKFSIAQVLLLVCAGFVLMQVACSGMNQDPFADQPENIRNGQRPGQKATPGPTPEAEILQIDSQEFYTFKEGEAGEAQISGRVLGSIDGEEAVLGRHYTLRVTNLDDFPGKATFDSATGTFRWTPSRETVQTDTTIAIPMTVVMETIRGKARARTKTINVFVIRDGNEPQIMDVDSFSARPVLEGENRYFSATVRDQDADLKNPPKLMTVPSQYGKSLAGFVTVNANPSRDSADPSLWRFSLTLTMGPTEITDSSTTASFGLIAISRFGRATAARTVDVPVYTRLAEPLTSWLQSYGEYVEFKTGRENLFTFNVYDPKSEGRLSFSFTTCPTGAECKCSSPTSFKAPVFCTIRWNLAADARLGDYSVEGTATSAHPVQGQSSMYSTVSRSIRVVQGAL